VINLAAEKIGWGVPPSFEANVHSVFRNAAILAHANGGLVTLAPSAAGGLPGAISIGVPEDFDFRKTLDRESRAAVRGGVLRFEGGALSVDLRAAIPWRSRLELLKLDLHWPATRRAWESAAEILSESGKANAFVRIARPFILALVDATSEFRTSNAEIAMTALIGLGAGGTPAGDDFLVGFLAGLRVTGGLARPTRRAFLDSVVRRTRSLLERTSDVSRVYLAAAADGEVSERLTNLAAAIAGGAPASTASRVAKEAIAVGHTSGADATLGFLLGTAARGPVRIARSVGPLLNEALVEG